MSASTNNAALAARLREIRESIRDRIASPEPQQQAEPIAAVALEDVRRAEQLAARYAGELGRPNPRPPGLANDAIQAGKGALARSFDWMLRPQREFNREVLQAISGLAAALERSDEAARSAFLAQGQTQQQELRQIREQLRELSELVVSKLERSEAETRESVRDLRWSYEGALARHIASVEETRRRLNDEVRELNRRLAAQAKAAATRPAVPTEARTERIQETAQQPRAAEILTSEVDYFALEKDFRGTEAEIRQRQSFYLPYFRNRTNVLDIACGRGEFLELMKDAGVSAKGVDLDADMVGRCLDKGLAVEQTDVFEYLARIADASLDGIFCSQFVEHLQPADYTRLILQVAQKLAPDGVLAVETQNPECLAIFSKSFYIDPTHVKPIPAAQLRFLFEHAGLEGVSTHYLSPAAAQLPLLTPLGSAADADSESLRAFNKAVEEFNAAFFGGMDYAVIGTKPAAK